MQDNNKMKAYQVLMHPDAYQKAKAYHEKLIRQETQAGLFLYKKLKGQDITKWNTERFIEALVQTKHTQIFAESAIRGNGDDWTLEELSILGDISIAVLVVFYDNGAHHKPLVHEQPFEGQLLFTPGALLRNDQGLTPVDVLEVVKDGQLDYAGFYGLYERRLLPVLAYANELARPQKKALISIPGLGCGMFAGGFKGQLGAQLQQVLFDILTKHGAAFPNIKAIYYDPYQECQNERFEINGISLMVRPLSQQNTGKSQLSTVTTFEDTGDDFSNCQLFSIVAWDHVSWPGNDFYIGSRATDDGVKAAASDVMFGMTGVKGSYSTKTNCYQPPKGYGNWNEVVIRKQLEIQVVDNLWLLPEE